MVRGQTYGLHAQVFQPLSAAQWKLREELTLSGFLPFHTNEHMANFQLFQCLARTGEPLKADVVEVELCQLWAVQLNCLKDEVGHSQVAELGKPQADIASTGAEVAMRMLVLRIIRGPQGKLLQSAELSCGFCEDWRQWPLTDRLSRFSWPPMAAQYLEPQSSSDVMTARRHMRLLNAFGWN